MAVSRILGARASGGAPAKLREAAHFLSAATDEEVLGAVIGDRDRIEAILGLAAGLDHVGFMVAPEEAQSLGPAAAEAGFDGRQRTFPSTILARQLAVLAGLDAVPTTIFKAWRQTADPRAVEVAIPRGVDAETTNGWIERGIGAHVAFRVESRVRLRELRPLMEAEGFTMPPFMNGAALGNPAERISAVFFDRRPAEPVGIEFCHYEDARYLSPSSPISSDISFR